MALFGWILLLVITCYITFVFFSGNIVSAGLSGKGMGKFENVALILVVCTMGYILYSTFPFEISIK